jgi:hypothetical protein
LRFEPVNACVEESSEEQIFQSVAPTDLPVGLIFRIRVKRAREKYFAFPEMKINL